MHNQLKNRKIDVIQRNKHENVQFSFQRSIFTMVITIIVMVAFIACDKDNDDNGGDKLQLLESIYHDGKLSSEYEYDEQNRMTKITSYCLCNGVNLCKCQYQCNLYTNLYT